MAPFLLLKAMMDSPAQTGCHTDAAVAEEEAVPPEVAGMHQEHPGAVSAAMVEEVVVQPLRH